MVKIAIKPKTEISPLKRKMKKFAKVNQSNKHTLRHQWKYYHYCLWWRKCFRQSTENIRKSDRMWIGMSRRYHKNDRLSSTNVIVMHRISEWKNAKINLDSIGMRRENTHGTVGILDDQQNGRIKMLHITIQCIQTETMLRGGIDQCPCIAFSTSRQMFH